MPKVVQIIPRIGDIIHVSDNGCKAAIVTSVVRAKDNESWEAISHDESWDEVKIYACVFDSLMIQDSMIRGPMQLDPGISTRGRIYGAQLTYHNLDDCDD